MKYLLVYYTGTYNTRFLTGKLKETLENNGHAVETVEINCDTSDIDTTGFDFIGFSYPIYGFNPPHSFLKYFFSMTFKPGQRYFIYKNSGETFAANNASSRRILRRMRRAKGVFCGEYHFVMPYNIHFEFPDEFIHQLVCEDKKLMEIMVHNLQNGIAPVIRSNIIYNIAAFFVSIQAIGGPVNSFFYRVDKSKCNICGLCAKTCPQKNITIRKDRVRFGHRCDMCMRCSFYCPRKAIQIGFLKNWRVHRYYDLENIWQNTRADAKYIKGGENGFYACFGAFFHRIDERYKQIHQ